MKPGAGQGSPLRVAPPVQSDTGQNYYMSRAELSYLSSAASRTVPSRWASGRGGVGVEIALGWAVPNVRARRWALQCRESLVFSVKKRQAGQAVAGRWRRWWAAWRGLVGAGRGGRRLPGALLRSLRSCSDKFQQSFDWRCPRSSSSTSVGHSCYACRDVYPLCKLCR